uniref:Uncharacterized protein n=1 Tax=Romanomermis culicivorax TaxID=13658 RepID=A0A915ICT7_ROMCU
MSEQFADESLAFLYKAAASRGPGKRQVRVVSREKLLANFESLGAASDDEEDDEDFKPGIKA